MKKAVRALSILSLYLIAYTASAVTADIDKNATPEVKIEKLSFSVVLTKAKKENKFVMVEFYFRYARGLSNTGPVGLAR